MLNIRGNKINGNLPLHFVSFDVEFIKLQFSIKTWCGNIKTPYIYY